MATSVLRHTDDDGVLSIFVSGTEILFVCENRHWWTVEAGNSGSASKPAALRAKRRQPPKARATKAETSLAALHDKFGPEIFEAMSLR